jgi:hypothetical protein
VKDINERTALFKRLFPYAFRQAGLRQDFRVNSGRCNVTYGGEVPQPTKNAPPMSAPPSKPNNPGRPSNGFSNGG